MKRCIDLAKNAKGQTYPNPMVGCVIVHEDKIIAEGFHQRAGEPHAEVNAINNLTDKKQIKNSILYVSLEPCSHFGKTPPCADLIIDKGFKKIVIGTTDPFAKVKGRGIKKLMANRCEVILGVLEDECLELNKRFMTFHQHQRPYVILKWAESQDGFLSPFEFGKDNDENPVWLTNSCSKQQVHQWRAEEQAILVGTHTALMDNPALTTRLWKGKNPLRVLIDKDLNVPQDSAIFSEDAQTLVFTNQSQPQSKKLTTDYCQIDFNQFVISQILKELHNRDIQSLIVEGGKLTLEHFIKENFWDEARVFRSPKKLEHGTSAPIFNAKAAKVEQLHKDQLTYYRNPAFQFLS